MSASDTPAIGIRLRLDGDQAVKTGLASVGQSLETVGAQAKSAAQQFTGISDVSGTLKTALGGIAAGLTIGAFKSMFDGSVKAAAGLHDLAIEGSTTVESLSGLASIGKYSDIGAAQIIASMNKLTKNLTTVTEDSAGTGKAIQALGLNLQAFAALRPEDQMQTVAKALDGFTDGASKSAVMMALYGKEGAKLLPFFKDLATAGELQAKITTEQANAADNYDDNLKRITASSDAWKKELVMGMIPAMDQAAQAYLGVINGTGGLRAAIHDLVEDGSIHRWTTATIKGLTFLMEPVEGLIKIFKVMGLSIGAAFATLNMEVTSPAAMVEKVKSIWSAFRADADAVMNADVQSQKIRARLDEYRNYKTAVKDVLDAYSGFSVDVQRAAMQSVREAYYGEEKAKLDASHLGKTPKTGPDEYDKLIAKIREKTTVATAELAATDKLSGAQKEALGMLDKLRTGEVILTEAQKEALGTEMARWLALDALQEAEKKAMKVAQERVAVLEKESQGIEQHMQGLQAASHAALETQQKRIEGLTDEMAAQDLAAAQNLTLAQAIERVAIARLKERQEAKAVQGYDEWDRLQAEIDQREKVLALIDTKELRERERSGWASVWQSIDQTAQATWTNVFEGGSDAFKKLGQTLKATVLDLLYKMTVRPFIVQVGTALLGSGFASAASAATANESGVLTGAAGSAAGSAVGGLMLGGASLGAIGSSIGAGFMATLSGQSIGAAATAYSAAGMGGVSAGLQIGAAAPWVLAAVAAASALGLFRQTNTVGGGLRGTLGEGDINAYDLKRKDGYLLGGPSYSLADRGVAEQSATIQASYDALRAGVGNMADALGLGSEAVRKFTTTLGTDVLHPDTGGIGIKLDGLTPEQATAKVNDALASANEDLARQVLGTWTRTTTSVTDRVAKVGAFWDSGVEGYDTVTRSITNSTYAASEYARTGETALATLQRLSGSLVSVNQWADTLGHTLLHGLAGADAASRLADAFGGIDAMNSAASSYYQQFYSESERTATLTRQTTEALAAMGLAMPATRDEFRQMVDAQLAAGDSGAANAAKLIKMSGALDQILPKFDTLEAKVVDLYTTAAQAFDQNAKTVADAATAAFEAQQSKLADLRSQATSQYLDAQRAVTTAQERLAGVLKDTLKGFQDFLSELDGASAAPPLQRLDAQRAAFESLSQRALAGDTTAAGQLQGSARSLLELSKTYSASYADYRRDEAGVRIVIGKMADLAGAALGKLPEQMQAITTPVDAAYADLASAIRAEFRAKQTAIGMQASLTDAAGDLVTQYRAAARAMDHLQSATLATDVAGTLESALNAALDVDYEALLTEQLQHYIPDMGPDFLPAEIFTTAITSTLPAMGDGFDMGDVARIQLQQRLHDVVPAMGEAFDLRAMTQQTLQNAINSIVGGVQISVPTTPAVPAAPPAATTTSTIVATATAGSTATAPVTSAAADVVSGSVNQSLLAYYTEQAASGRSDWVHASARYADQIGLHITDLVDVMHTDPLGWERNITSGGWKNVTADELTHRIGVPAFEVGINRVPRDMLAQIHEGEAVVPAAYNPFNPGAQAWGQGDGAVRVLVAEVKALRDEVVRLRTEQCSGHAQIAANTGKVARITQKFDDDGMPAVRK